MRKLICLSIFLSVSFNSFSGVNDTLELKTNKDFTYIRTLDDGLLIIHDEGLTPNKTKIIERYDTNFNLVKKTPFTLEFDSDGRTPYNTFLDDDKYYMLYYDYKKKRIQIAVYNLLSNIVEVGFSLDIGVKPPFKSYILNNHVYIPFNKVGIMHYKASLITCNIKTGEILNIDLPSATRTQLPIKDMYLNEDMNEINIIFQSSIEDDSELEIIRFDSLGNRIQPSFYIEEPKSNFFPQPNILKVDKNNFFITGLSTIKAQKGDPIITNFATSREEQFFISFYESSKMKWIKYFDFRNAKSVKSFYNDKYKIQHKKQFVKEDKIYFIAEAYFPTYTWVDTYDGRMGKTTKKQQVVDFYEYTHSFALCFDKNNGELVWDVSFPSYVKTKVLKNVIRNIYLSEDISIVVEDDKMLKKIRIEDNGEISSENYSEPELTKPTQNFYILSKKKWYSNYSIEITYTNFKKKGVKDIYKIRKY